MIEDLVAQLERIIGNVGSCEITRMTARHDLPWECVIRAHRESGYDEGTGTGDTLEAAIEDALEDWGHDPVERAGS